MRTGPLRGARTPAAPARLTVTAPASRVRLRITDLPGLLYRVSTPAGSGLAPVVIRTGSTVRVGLRPTGDDGPETIDILLNRAARWHVRLIAGAGEQHLDLTGGRISALELGAGVGLVRIRLPRPGGTVEVRLTGSVGRAEIVAPAGVPVRIGAGAAIETLTVPWAARTVPAGTHLTPRGWATAAERYRLDVAMSVGTLTVRE